MVEKIFRIFNKEFGGLHQAAFLLGVFALLSQILALVRDRLFAHLFGASATLDIYYTAFRIPDFLFVSLASFVSLTVLIPFILDKIERNNEEARMFINNIFSVFFIVLVGVSIIVYFLIPQLSAFLFAGFSGKEQEDLIIMTRILLFSPILLGISNLFGSITQAFKKFFVYALSPVLYNLGIIVGVVFFYPIFGIAGLAYGVVLGAALHLLIQVPVVYKAGFLPSFMFPKNMREIKSVIVTSLPRTIGLSANHFALLFLISIASFMAEGSISVFNLSFNLQSVPLAIIGVSYSVAAFPTLARFISRNEIEYFVRDVVVAMRHILFWSLPAVALFVVLRAQIVRTVLGSGEFGWTETRLTAAALALFVISLAAQSLMLLFVRGYYAAGKTFKPLVVNVVSSIAIVLGGYMFVDLFSSAPVFRFFIESLFRVEDLPGTVVLMLPLAYSLGSLINVFLLMFFFKQDFGKFPRILHETFWHSFSGAVFMGFVAYHFLNIFDDLFDLNTFWGIFFQGLFSGIIGIVVGVILLEVMGNQEIKEIRRALRSRFWKAKPVAPEKEELL